MRCNLGKRGGSGGGRGGGRGGKWGMFSRGMADNETKFDNGHRSRYPQDLKSFPFGLAVRLRNEQVSYSPLLVGKKGSAREGFVWLQ